jgi:hypothetical protein
MRQPTILPKRFQRSAPRGRGAPQFSTRATWWKLFLLCGTLVLVLAVAEQARKPDAWRFFDRLDGSARKEAPPDPRIFAKPSRTEYDPAGTFVAVRERVEIPADGNEQEGQPADLAERAWQQGWKEILVELPAGERGTLYEGMWRSRQRELLSGELMRELAIVADALDGRWTAYQTEALESLSDLSEEDREAWSMVLQRADARWKQEVKPALASLCDGRSPTEAEYQALVAWQTVLDDLQLKAVRDDTVWRGSEREIWFRLLERVQASDGAEEATRATYGQLFKQPKDYRGQWVTIRGAARQAYRVKAPENWLNIPYYYVFVVQPEDGANSPIIIYSLEAPANLPPIKDKDADRGTTALRDDIEFTGIFFKRWAYLGQDGTYVAPLLLAKTGRVHQSPLAKTHAELPSPEFLAWIIGGVLLVSVTVTGFAYWLTGRGTSAVNLPAERDIMQSLNSLEQSEKRAL